MKIGTKPGDGLQLELSAKVNEKDVGENHTFINR